MIKGQSNTSNNNINAVGVLLSDIFENPSANDYSLVDNSIVVNVGSNDSVPNYITTDLAGNPRVFANIVDLGAFENQTLPDIGINENASFTNINLYPNPVKNFVTVELGELYTKGSVELINSVGSVMQRINLINQDKITLNMEGLANGIYFVQVKSFDKNRMITEKVIKQ